MLTVDQLKEVMPRMARNPLVAESYLQLLNSAMAEAAINTRLRICAFIAQLAHESGEFRFMEEVWGPSEAQKRYEPPSTLAVKLGNTQKGDGYRYKGRGPIQLTGRSNYAACGKALGVDLVNHPELAAQPATGFRAAAWFWSTHGLNAKADAGDFDGITKAINGGFNGKEHRDDYYRKALAVIK